MQHRVERSSALEGTGQIRGLVHDIWRNPKGAISRFFSGRGAQPVEKRPAAAGRNASRGADGALLSKSASNVPEEQSGREGSVCLRHSSRA